MNNDSNYIDALKKKATGFSATEVSEEYSVDDTGDLILKKGKSTQNTIRLTPLRSKALWIWIRYRSYLTRN